MIFDLYEEFRILIASLGDRQIEYAVCDGIAMAVYDHPRATVDIALLILYDSLADVIEVATGLSYTIRGLDMTFANGAVEIRRVSKIDSETGILLSLDLLLVTPEIREVWNSRTRINWAHGDLSIVSREGLLKLKEMRGSPQDMADISALKEDLDEAN